MTPKTFTRLASPVALSVLLAACGSGGGSSGSGGNGADHSQSPDLGTASGSTDGSDSADTGASVSGRVADGYIKGAVVCVDINANDACDADEPSTVTGDGGAYQLDLPAGSEGKPIVADIPAEAIDEDTGDAVGKQLVFIAPADKPNFLSPITTLVQQELRANPALDVDEAEAAVKSMLGIDEAEVSLFVDYVAESEEGGEDAEIAERFRYLHDTARVVASMMKDIEEQVESAAVAQGVDVAGSVDTRRAIREIVRSEVRELLPEIAREVAQLVTDADVDTDDGTGSGTGEAVAADEFDPGRIAAQLRPSDAADNVRDRIEAVRDRVDPELADMRRLLTDGMYWTNVDCGHGHHEPMPVDVPERPDGAASTDGTAPAPDGDHSVATDGAGDPTVPEPLDFESKCHARYGHVQLDADGDELVAAEYEFDAASGGWVDTDESDEEGVADYALIGGEWVAVEENEPEGTVAFTDDGVAVITNAAGETRVKAATLPVATQPVLHHMLDRMAHPIWFDLLTPADLFASDGRAYALSIRQSSHPYVLFNNRAVDAAGQYPCAEYGGNCNVVGSVADQRWSAVTSLDVVRESAPSGIKLAARGAGFGRETLMKLSADATADGSLPREGKVEWMPAFGPPHHGIGPDGYHGDEGPDPYGTFPEGEVPYGECDGPHHSSEHLEGEFPSGEFPDGQYPDGEYPDGQYPDGGFPGGELPDDRYPDGEYPDLGCPDLIAQVGDGSVSGPVPGGDDGDFHGDEYPDRNPEFGFVPSSSWKVVEVDGVTMIAIELPLSLRHDDGAGSEEALLLVEHEGFVRLGARLPRSRIEREITYNEAAFTTLRAIVESALRGER